MAGLLSDEELIDKLYGPNADTVDADVYRRFGLTPNLKRGTVLPIARDEQGNLTPAVPQAVIDFLKAVSLPGHVVRGGQYTPQDVREMAANVGLLGSVATKPAGALASGLARNAAELPMDEASRMARADAMFPIEAYHGASRLDRLLAKPGLDPKRATSGPMPFFTDAPELASSYAKNKADTSRLSEGNASYSDWFKIIPKGARTEKTLDEAWGYMTPSEKARITEDLGNVGFTDEAYTQIGKTKENVGGAGRDHWEFTLKEHRGNALAAARDLWLDSGNLFGQEEKFMDVLKAANIPGVKYDSPHMTAPGVLPARLRINNPFETTTENLKSVLPAMREAAKNKRGQSGGVDPWDKNAVSGRAFIERLESDIENGTTHAWTSIPDWATDVLKKAGYDGIKDLGGKMGGPGHTVYIPFSPNQVRSRFAAFDPAKKESADLLAGVAGLPGVASFLEGVNKDSRKRDISKVTK
jgi:hypothetical protein